MKVVNGAVTGEYFTENSISLNPERKEFKTYVEYEDFIKEQLKEHGVGNVLVLFSSTMIHAEDETDNQKVIKLAHAIYDSENF